MSERLDVRDLPPSERHPEIHEAFDPGGYTVERRGVDEFVATLPKEVES